MTFLENSSLQCFDKARNIGVVFDETLSLDKHVSSICKSALFHLWNIVKIRMYLTSDFSYWPS